MPGARTIQILAYCNQKFEISTPRVCFIKNRHAFVTSFVSGGPKKKHPLLEQADRWVTGSSLAPLQGSSWQTVTFSFVILGRQNLTGLCYTWISYSQKRKIQFSKTSFSRF